MKTGITWMTSPPALVLAALCLVLLAPVDELPGSSRFTFLCPEGDGRIAVAALGMEPDTEISGIAGRAPYFLIFESRQLQEILPNEHANTERGAGTRTAYWLSDLEIDCLVAGEVGSRMRAVLDSEGIAFALAEGEATAAISPLRGPGDDAAF